MSWRVVARCFRRMLRLVTWRCVVSHVVVLCCVGWRLLVWHRVLVLLCCVAAFFVLCHVALGGVVLCRALVLLCRVVCCFVAVGCVV